MRQGPDTATEAVRPHDRPSGGRLASATEQLWRGRESGLSVAVAFLLSRAAVLFTAKVTAWYSEMPRQLSDLLTSWDGGWYIFIAQAGYPATTTADLFGNRWAFFPGLPAAIRITHWVLPLDWRSSALVVTFLTGGAAITMVYLVVREHLGTELARDTAVLMCFLPNAYILSMVYTEGLFLTLAAACLLLLARRQWALAGAAAALSCLVRSAGVILVLCCAVEAVRVVIRSRSWRPLTAAAIAPVGLLTWMAYSWHRVDDPLAFQTAQKDWGNDFDWFRPVGRAVRELATDRAAWQMAAYVLGIGAIVVALVCLVALWRLPAVPVTWWVYSVAVILVAASPRYLSSVPRYLYVAFPLYAALLHWVPAQFRVTVVATAAVAMGALTFGVLYSLADFTSAPLAP